MTHSASNALRLLAALALVASLAGCSSCDDDSGGSGGDTDGVNNAANNGSNNGGGTNNDTTANNDGGTTGNNASNNDGDPCASGGTFCVTAQEVGECRDGEPRVIEICDSPLVCQEGACVNTTSCEPGEVDGCWDEGAQRVCNEAGDAFVSQACTGATPNCLQGECTDMICVPESQNCADANTLEVCNEAGDAYVDQAACPDGSVCLEGACLSGCDLSDKFPSYIGCQYWSLDLDNYPDPAGRPDTVPHAVVVSNPSEQDATVAITTLSDATLDPETFMVPAGGVATYEFPRLDVDGTGITYNSFFLESSWPVVAYQFNPLNNVGVASNDGSLLLPSEFLGTEYIVMTLPTSPGGMAFGLPNQHGYFTIVATRPGTTDVRIELTTDVSGGDNVPFMEGGQTYDFTLNQYQVLSLEANAAELLDFENDLTGTIITATQPIAVFGGHEEAVVDPGGDNDNTFPNNMEDDGSCCAEHLEEQLFPVNTWGTRYLAARSEPRGGSRDVWRVVASEPNTTVETVPPQEDADGVTIGRGEWIHFSSDQSFEVTADKPIMVGQFLASQQTTEGATGDPAFILQVPLSQFRSDYTILVPDDYTQDWLTVVRPAGVEITLDGSPIPGASFNTFGTGEYEYAWVLVEDGPHTLEAEAPFGLSAYGYSNVVSYGYPAGLNLDVREQ